MKFSKPMYTDLLMECRVPLIMRECRVSCGASAIKLLRKRQTDDTRDGVVKDRQPSGKEFIGEGG